MAYETETLFFQFDFFMVLDYIVEALGFEHTIYIESKSNGRHTHIHTQQRQKKNEYFAAQDPSAWFAI